MFDISTALIAFAIGFALANVLWLHKLRQILLKCVDPLQLAIELFVTDPRSFAPIKTMAYRASKGIQAARDDMKFIKRIVEPAHRLFWVFGFRREFWWQEWLELWEKAQSGIARREVE